MKSPIFAILGTPLLVLVLVSCNGGGGSTAVANPTPVVTPVTDIMTDSPTPGVTPYISFIKLHGTGLVNVKEIDYTIEPKAGYASKPVAVSYSFDYLVRRGYASATEQTLTLPIFGLYASYLNTVDIKVVFEDSSSIALPIQITTAAPTGVAKTIYNKPIIKKARAPGSKLGFNYFYMESLLGTPVVVDTDGEVRWVGPGTMNSQSSFFFNNGFVIGSALAPNFYRFELDGTTTSAISLVPMDQSVKYTTFHHSIGLGKTGLFIMADANINGQFTMESLLTEVESSLSGKVIAEWDFATILTQYMRSYGDDPTPFILGDWFHLNSAIYDPSDDSIIASSRENFVIKIDYRTGNIIWIFGDPTKYWYTFPSLRAKSITLSGSGAYPIGQHALSFTQDGLLLMFNNGFPSLYLFGGPSGVPLGAALPYSIVAAYSIDGNSRTARQVWQYDHGQYPPPDFCSSAFQSSDSSTLINYTVWPATIKTSPVQITFTDIVGLDSTRQPSFEFQYINVSFCTTSWAAQPLPFEALSFK